MLQCIYSLSVFLLGQVLLAQHPEMSYVVETAPIIPVEKFLITRRYIGTIRAENFSLLTPKTSGTIARIDVVANQRVKKGQVLASLASHMEKRRLEELTKKNLRSLEKDLSRHRSLLASQDVTKSALEGLERNVLKAQIELENQRHLVEDVEISAPFDGLIGVPRVVLGESVLPTTPIISIMKGPYSVFINIPASRLAEIRVGQPVKIKSINTTIAAVEKSIDPLTRTGFAKAIFDRCEDCIIGDSVYVSITVHEKANVILISRSAIYFKNQKPHVVVVIKGSDGKDYGEIREVSLGEEQEGKVEVVSGLKAGDLIVNANPKRIPPGALLTVFLQ